MCSELIEWELRHANDIEIEDRRKFLISCGKFAAVTPPAMTLLLSTSLTSTAIAQSGLSDHDSGPGRSFFDNDPDAPKEKQATENSGSRNDQASRDGNQASVGGAGGGGGSDGGGAGGGTSSADSRGGGSSSSGGGAGSASRYGGGEDDKWR
jgi:hypothetical protein